LASNPLRAIILDRVTDFLLFIGRLSITIFITILGFLFFTNKFNIKEPVKSYLVPETHYFPLVLAIVSVISYFIAKLFFSVFEIAIDTIFLCALKDLEENEGTQEKPYFMSKSLRKILNVANNHQEEKRQKKEEKRLKKSKPTLKKSTISPTSNNNETNL
jgi:solute carrier family 44 (choline transporter-like protein), member 2/4/5